MLVLENFDIKISLAFVAMNHVFPILDVKRMELVYCLIPTLCLICGLVLGPISIEFSKTGDKSIKLGSQDLEYLMEHFRRTHPMGHLAGSHYPP